MLFYIVIISGLLGLYLYIYFRGQRRVPPGLKDIPIERGLPIIGVVNKIEKPLCNYLVKLGHKHGPIYRIRIGIRDIVVLNTFEYIKAAMVDNGNALSGRWKSLKYVFVTENSGIILIDGNVWSVQRSFVLKNMKNFGMGRSRSMEIVQDECVCLLEDLEKLEGKRIDFAHFISIYVANVISKFMMNKRFTHGDPLFQVIQKCMKLFVNSNDSVSNLSLMFPFIENNEWLMNFIIWVTSRKSFFIEYHKIFENEIKDHSTNLDYTSEGEDLMDRFLIKQHKLKEKHGNVESFTNIQLVRITSDLIAAGYDTTTSLLVWSFMFMGLYPEVQDKVYEEINDQIGSERLPSMSDKVTLNYTQAVMDETLRLSSVVPLSVMHRTLDDVNVKGYFIPKDTVVIPNIFACHLDPNIWEKPRKFYPEHFLFTDHNNDVKYRPREELIPFGMGKRQCLGESLAKMDHFLFFTSVLQKYQVRLANENDRNAHFDAFRANEGMVRTIDVKEFVFSKRL